MKKNHILRIGAFSLLSAGFASGQTTRAVYDFATTNTPQQVSVDTDPDTTASDFAVDPTGSMVGAGYSSSSFSAFVRLSQTNASNLAEAITNEQYSNFTVTIDNGPIDLGAFKFRHFVTQFNAANDYNIALLCSLTGFSAGDVIDTIQPSTAATAGVTSEIPLFDPAFAAIPNGTVVEFRLYYFDSNNNNNQIYRVDDVEVLSQALPDPLLDLAAGTADSDLTFPNAFSLGTDLTKTVTYEASSSSGSGSVTIDALTLTGDGDHSTGGFSVSSVPAVPVTLNDGETIAITVTADSSEAGAFAGSLLIDTTVVSGNQAADALDTTLASSSQFYTTGDKLNGNGAIEGSVADWGGFPSFVQPGIAPDSAGMIRVKGEGDPLSANAPDSAYQAEGIPDGAPDFELTAYFSPINGDDFEAYTGISAGGDFADRTFQWFLLSSDAISGTNYTDTSAAATLINLAYLPDGNVNGGTPDFYLFDGTNWIATGIGAIEGSVDNNATVGDGLLDTTIDPLDVINVYRLSVKGSGFGTPAASYDISVTKTSGPDSFTSGSATGLTVFHSVSGTTDTPAAHGFTTADISADTNPDDAFTTSFWIDEVCFSNVEFADPSMSVSPGSLTLSSHNNVPSPTTGTISITNTGFTNDLTVSSLTLSASTGITLPTPPSTPVVIPAGTSLEVEVQFGPSLISPLTAETATITIVSDAVTDATQTVSIAAQATSDSNLLVNCDFEVAGDDSSGDTDTFAGWDEGNSNAIQMETTDVPGLVSGSSTAAYLNQNTVSSTSATLEGTLAEDPSDFSLGLSFAVSAPLTEATASEVSTRMLNLLILSAGNGNQVNIRFIENSSGTGVFQVFQDGGAGWVDIITLPVGTSLSRSLAINDDGDLNAAGSTKNVYRLSLDCTGMGSPNASYDFEVFDTDGITSLGQANNLALFQTNGAATGSLSRVVQLTTENGNCSSFWVDEACASVLSASDDLSITAYSYDGPGNDFVISFTGAASTTYNVESSADLQTAFAAIPGVTATTDGSGVGTATVPSANVGSGKNFFRIAEQP